MFNLQTRSEENTNTKPQTVQSTQDYARFKYLQGNRDLKEGNIKAIQNQVQQCGQRIPIVINEKNEIIDGQHRLEACKRLGIPVKFIVDVGANIDHVISANIVGQKWSLMDYVNRYSSEGNGHYQRLHDFIIECKKHGISASAAMSIVNNGKSYKGYYMYDDGKIRQHGGKYKVKKLYYVGDDVRLGYFRIESLKEPRKRLEAIIQFKHFAFYKKSYFINAILQVMRIKDFDVKRLRQAADTYPNRFVNEPDVDGFVRMFESVYNYRMKTKLPLVNHPERSK